MRVTKQQRIDFLKTIPGKWEGIHSWAIAMESVDTCARLDEIMDLLIAEELYSETSTVSPATLIDMINKARKELRNGS